MNISVSSVIDQPRYSYQIDSFGLILEFGIYLHWKAKLLKLELTTTLDDQHTRTTNIKNIGFIE